MKARCTASLEFVLNMLSSKLLIAFIARFLSLFPSIFRVKRQYRDNIVMWHSTFFFFFSQRTTCFDARFFRGARVCWRMSLGIALAQSDAPRRSNRVAWWRSAHCCPVIFANPCLPGGVLAAVSANAQPPILPTTLREEVPSIFRRAQDPRANPRSFFPSHSRRTILDVGYYDTRTFGNTCVARRPSRENIPFSRSRIVFSPS